MAVSTQNHFSWMQYHGYVSCHPTDCVTPRSKHNQIARRIGLGCEHLEEHQRRHHSSGLCPCLVAQYRFRSRLVIFRFDLFFDSFDLPIQLAHEVSGLSRLNSLAHTTISFAIHLLTFINHHLVSALRCEAEYQRFDFGLPRFSARRPGCFVQFLYHFHFHRFLHLFLDFSAFSQGR